MATSTLAGTPCPPKTEAVELSVSRLDRSSAIAMSGGLLSQGLKFLVMVYVVRHFSVAQFGLLSFAIATNAYMFVISSFGLNVFGSRAIAKSGWVPAGLVAEIFSLEFSLALLGTGLALGALNLRSGVGRLELLLVALFGLSNVIQAGLFDWVFQGLRRQDVSAALNIFWQGAWLGLTMGGIKLGCGIAVVPAALCTAALLTAIFGYYWMHRTAPLEPSIGTAVALLPRCWQTLRSASFLGWGTVLVTIILWGDTIAVRLIKGEQAVGCYAAGNRTALALAMLSGFYVQGAFPSLSRACRRSPAQYNLLFQHCYQEMSMLFVPGCLWATAYAREIVLLLFRRTEFLASVSVFRIFQMMLLLAAMSNLYGIGGLVVFHRDRDYQAVLLLTAAFFIPLCGLLTTYYGISGAAMAALLGQGVCLFLFIRQSRGLVRVNHWAALLAPVSAGIGVAALGKFAGMGLLSSAAFLLVTYCGLFGARAWLGLSPLGADFQ